MDISFNMIDLEFLSNPRLNIQKPVIIDGVQKDIRFYRKRILKMTKLLLCEKKQDKDIERGFRTFALNCINYFKFLDKAEIIQKEYDEKKKKKREVKPLDKNIDRLVMKDVKMGPTKIPECFPIKITNKKKKVTIMPKTRNINISEPKFRTKGLEKKNMHNKYEESEKKKKTNKTDKKKKKKKKKDKKI